MNPKTLLATSLVLVSGSRVIGQNPDKPLNIIFIMSDDHASRAISCYGSGLNSTPNIDKLASDGIRFTKACVTNSISGPSRACLLTGKYSHVNGFMTNDNTFDGSQQTFPKLLQKAGYATAVIGKWHLVSNPTGFDYWDVLPGQGDYYNPVFIENGQRKTEKGYVTEIITQKSIQWLNTQKESGKPFCLLMHHKAPHRNWLPSPKHVNDFKGVNFPVPTTFYDDYSGRENTAGAQHMRITRDMIDGYDLKLNVIGHPDSIVNKGQDSWQSRMDSTQWSTWVDAYAPLNDAFYSQNLSGKALAEWKYQRYMHDYLATVQSVDESVGELIRWLKANGLYENTLIVYTSDQGFYTGEHGWFDKRFMYEESLLTPLIIHNPAESKHNAVCNSLVQNIDFAPTLLDMAGVPIPSDMQGISLKPLLHDPTAKVRDAVYYQYFEFPAEHSVKRHYGIRTERYKLIHFYYDEDSWEFYDLTKDPDEMHNLIHDKRSQNTIKSLRKQLLDLRKKYKVPELQEELQMGFLHVTNKAKDMDVQFTFPPSIKYSGGKNVLTNGIIRTMNAWHPGDLSEWQGIEGNNMEVVVKMRKTIKADSISVNCLDHESAWILLPAEVIIEVSSDGNNYQKLAVSSSLFSVYSNRRIVHYSAKTGNDSFQYVRIRLLNRGFLPDTHPAKGKPAWVFADEIIVN